MAESRRIAAIMRGGDVVMISIEEEGSPVRYPPVVPCFFPFSSSYRLKLKAALSPGFWPHRGALMNP